MLSSIASIEKEADDSWKFFVRRADGTLGQVKITNSALVDCGVQPFGQVILQCLLGKSEAVG